MNEYENKVNELLEELSKQEELKNKKLLIAVWTIIIISLIFYLEIVVIAAYILPESTLQNLIVLIATSVLVISCFIALKFEIDAGYYECKKCHHKFTPSYKEAICSMHIVTTRYLKCPKCNKKGWSKKILKK